jgi:hypothetical protein
LAAWCGIDPVDPFGFSWTLAVSLRRPPIIRLGLSWISLDSSVRIESYQWVTGFLAGTTFLAPSSLALEASQRASVVSACGSAGLFMAQA